MFTNNIENAKQSIKNSMDLSFNTYKSLMRKHPDKAYFWRDSLYNNLNGKADMVLWLLEDPNKDDIYRYALEYKDKILDNLQII